MLMCVLFLPELMTSFTKVDSYLFQYGNITHPPLCLEFNKSHSDERLILVLSSSCFGGNRSVCCHWTASSFTQFYGKKENFPLPRI